ncbi:hypothetical protein IAU60_001355 [Kwoniella sp. DSM 27419]
MAESAAGDTAPQSEAAKRAAARKAKILARGNTGLAKLAQTARGDEAQSLYADDFKPSPLSTPRTETPPPVPTPAAGSSSTSSAAPRSSKPQATAKPSWAPPPPAATGQVPSLSADQQAMSAQLEAMMSMFGGAGGPAGGAGGAGTGAEGMPDFSRLMAQMMGDPSLAGGAPGQNLLGDMDDPAGLGGMGPGGIPPNLFGGGGVGAEGQMPFAFPGMAPPRQSKVEKYFPLVHFVAVVLLAMFTLVWWEPAIRATAPLSGVDRGFISRWGTYIGSKRFRLSGVEPVPVFWAFTTVELLLQTTRFMIFKSPPKPHGLLQTFGPLLPPTISGPLITGSRYLALLSQAYKDGALFVFVLGMATIVGHWIDG